MKIKYLDRANVSAELIEQIPIIGKKLSHRSFLFTGLQTKDKLADLLTGKEVHAGRSSGGLALTYSSSLSEPLPAELEIKDLISDGVYTPEVMQDILKIIGERTSSEQVVEIGKYFYEGNQDLQEFLFLNLANVLRFDNKVRDIVVLAAPANSKLYKRKYDFEPVYTLPDNKLIFMMAKKENFIKRIQNRIIDYLPNYSRGMTHE